jgi:poly-gamma-glutamate synthesis protein (capsule biosynthesis protein)
MDDAQRSDIDAVHPQVSVLLVGDVILDEPEPDSFFAPARETLQQGDVVIGQLEVPHSDSRETASTDVPATPSDPAALAALPRAGFHVMTLAGNHIYDAGTKGVLDTVRHARAVGLHTTGAGADLAHAREPAVVERAGVRVAVLSYNCVGPRESWATSRKAGCAHVQVLTHYELDHASPGGPPRIYTFAEPDDVDSLGADIRAARERADAVIVSFHKGIGHTPAVLAMYERPLAHAAIDFGADAVFGHHAHIMRGIEVYRGRPIFHGLGNFVAVTHALNPSEGGSAEREAWARRRVELFGFAPDPNMPNYPFHPQSRNTAIGTVRLNRRGIVGAGLIPCWIDDASRPVPVARSGRGSAVLDYIAQINSAAGLSTAMEWLDDQQVVLPQVGRRAEPNPAEESTTAYSGLRAAAPAAS